MQGGAEVDRIQAAEGRWPSGLGQDPDRRSQVNQVDLVQHGRQAGDGARGVPGQGGDRGGRLSAGRAAACESGSGLAGTDSEERR